MHETAMAKDAKSQAKTPPRPKTKILVDGGDPEETLRIKRLIGFVDGQTTNPSLVAKNPDILKRVQSGQKLTEQEQKNEYKKIVQSISPLVGDAGVSIEVFADYTTTAEDMFEEGQEMYNWIPNAYIKYPTITEGLKAAKMSVADGMRVNMTLCFTQEQAAAVYSATQGSSNPVYVSPFIGRLDDIGLNGAEVIKNIKQMFAKGDGHVVVLAASLRSLEHLLYCFSLETELATVPGTVLDQWAQHDFPMPGPDFAFQPVGKPIPYKEVDLEQPWESYDIEHQLTRQGIEKFVADYKSTIHQ